MDAAVVLKLIVQTELWPHITPITSTDDVVYRLLEMPSDKVVGQQVHSNSSNNNVPLKVLLLTLVVCAAEWMLTVL